MQESTIEWNSLDLREWEGRFSKIRRTPLLQSYDYARAVCPVYGQRAQWGLIRIDGEEAGLVQMLEAGLFGRALHAMAIDRGPLWLPGFGGIAHVRGFFDAIQREFPGRIGRRRRIIPEIPKSPVTASLLEQAGFFYIGPDYMTTWLDLSPDLADLRAGLRKNWRNALAQAERGPLRVEWDKKGLYIEELIAGYSADRAARGYPGPSPRLLRALAQTFAQGKKCLIGRALLDNETVSAILMLEHGCSATYQIGWNTPQGRRYGGHYRLLWSSLDMLKGEGIIDLDLGGLNDDDAENLSAFKDGLGGQRQTLAGLYR